jgi:DNA-binding MarR family transcriptional regulator
MRVVRKKDEVLRQINGLQAQLDELKSQLDLVFVEVPRALASPALVVVQSVIRARRSRDTIFGDLFSDPAWDILLELYAATLSKTRIPTSKLCKAAAVPATTALRWIEKLDRMGWVLRRADPFDSRRVFVELTPTGATAMETYFKELEPGIVTT